MPTNIKTGTVTGTGAALNVSLGFAPDHVIVINDTTLDRLDWYSNMPAASGYKSVAVGTRTKITVNGISLFTGSATQQAGFTLGTDGTNANTNVLRYFATANGPGGL